MKNIIIILFIAMLISCNTIQKQKSDIDRDICNTVIECLGAIKKVVEFNWYQESNRNPGLKSTVFLELDENYNAVKVELVKTSGSTEFDRSAIRAVYKSSPFNELRGLIEKDYQKFKSMSFVFAPDR